MLKPFRLSILSLGLAASFAFALPASAQQTKQQTRETKQRNQAAPQSIQQNTQRQADDYRYGAQPGGGLYFQGYYLGDDPDPFIRSQIMRDLSARFPSGD